MATMNITITVNAKGVKWSRTASIEVDTAQYQQGDTGNTFVVPVEGGNSSMGVHSYAGLAVALLANKAKGSIQEVDFYTGTDKTCGVSLSTHHPFIIYAGTGTGFSGAINGSATSTDTPTLDVDSSIVLKYIGSQNTQILAGLKPIS